MLIRISLILAIIAGLAVGALNFITVKQKVITLQTNLALVAALTEKDKAEADAALATKHAGDLADKLAKATKDLSDTKDELFAYQSSGLTSAQVLSLVKDLKALQANLTGAHEENKLLGQKLKKVENELAFYKEPEHKVPLPASAQGKILISDPKWDFVILNIGVDQGVLERGELLVSRNGRLVGKVIVRSVQKDRSIANVLPGWKIGDAAVMEGDLVIPAYPES